MRNVLKRRLVCIVCWFVNGVMMGFSVLRHNWYKRESTAAFLDWCDVILNSSSNKGSPNENELIGDSWWWQMSRKHCLSRVIKRIYAGVWLFSTCIIFSLLFDHSSELRLSSRMAGCITFLSIIIIRHNNYPWLYYELETSFQSQCRLFRFCWEMLLIDIVSIYRSPAWNVLETQSAPLLKSFELSFKCSPISLFFLSIFLRGRLRQSEAWLQIIEMFLQHKHDINFISFFFSK